MKFYCSSNLTPKPESNKFEKKIITKARNKTIFTLSCFRDCILKFLPEKI